MDLYGANVVVPLTEVTQGQLRLHEVVLIDHAYTLEPGLAMRRPVWLDRKMARIAPELRDALRHDQEALMLAFSQAGAELPGYSRLPGNRDQHSRRVWAEYDAPQELQHLLDKGEISRDAAMQYAAATAMEPLLATTPPSLLRERLSNILGRMSDPEPALRYPTLTEAADALATALGAVPMVSEHRYGPLSPADLALPAPAPASAPTDEPVPARTARPARPRLDEGTCRADDICTAGAEPAHARAASRGPSQPKASSGDGWVGDETLVGSVQPIRSTLPNWPLYAAAVLAAAAGACFPLPW
jgi:hypothetical protein